MMNIEEQLRKISMAYEKKLIDLMGEDAFRKFAENVARELFADEICQMADSDFKESLLNNFDAITGSEEDYQKLMGNIQPHHVEAHCMPAGNCFECKHAIAINEKFIVCDLINEGSHKCKFEKKAEIRDCDHCIHHVYYPAGDFHACDSWECKFKKKEDDSDGG